MIILSMLRRGVRHELHSDDDFMCGALLSVVGGGDGIQYSIGVSA